MSEAEKIKTIKKITPSQISAHGVQALADRPNMSGHHGVGGLSPTELKKWFDKLATLLADHHNEICEILSSEEAGKYIGVLIDEHDIYNLYDFVKSVKNGNIVDIIPVEDIVSDAYSQTSPLSTVLYWLQFLLNRTILTKLDMVDKPGTHKRVYAVNEAGEQKMVNLSDSPLAEAIPVYSTDGQLKVADPADDTHVVNKSYVDKAVRQAVKVAEKSQAAAAKAAKDAEDAKNIIINERYVLTDNDKFDVAQMVLEMFPYAEEAIFE